MEAPVVCAPTNDTSVYSQDQVLVHVQYLRSAITQPAPPLYITANQFLPVIVLCLLTGELEIRNKQRIQVIGITKSF